MFITDVKSIEKIGKDYKISGDITITVPASNKMAVIVNGVVYLATPDNVLSVENNQITIGGVIIPIISIIAVDIPTQFKKTSTTFYDYSISSSRFRVEPHDENSIYIIGSDNRRVKIVKCQSYIICNGTYFKEVNIEDFKERDEEMWLETDSGLININRIYFIGDPVI